MPILKNAGSNPATTGHLDPFINSHLHSQKAAVSIPVYPTGRGIFEQLVSHRLRPWWKRGKVETGYHRTSIGGKVGRRV